MKRAGVRSASLEILLALVAVDHDLAVDDVPAGRERKLGEVA